MSTSVEPVAVARRLPGDLAMWFFILAELSVFALLILAFTVAQALHPQMFSEGRQLLDRSTGLAMTLSLLTAGLFAALAQEQVRQDRPRRGAVSLWLALLFASGYVGSNSPNMPIFRLAAWAWSATRFSRCTGSSRRSIFLHVLLGMVILGWLAERCRRRRHDSQRCSGLESGVLYWHMVDLIWVVLFPVVYVLD